MKEIMLIIGVLTGSMFAGKAMDRAIMQTRRNVQAVMSNMGGR